MPLSFSFWALSRWAATFLVTTVLQGAVLATGVALSLRYAQSLTPVRRTQLLSAFSILLLLLSALSAAPARIASGDAFTTVHLGLWCGVWLLGAWVCLSCLRGVRLVRHAVNLWGIRARAHQVEAGPQVAALLQAAKRHVLLCASVEVGRPSVIGFFQPRVMLPVGLSETLSPTELEHVVVHELEHLRRFDDWFNLLLQVGLVLMPWNPALLWLERRLASERELACDDEVLRRRGSPRAYAACLVKLAEQSLIRERALLALSALGSRAKESELSVRIRRILAGSVQQPSTLRMHWTGCALVCTTLAAAALVSTAPPLIAFDGSRAIVAVSAPAPAIGSLSAQSTGAGSPVTMAESGHMLRVSATESVSHDLLRTPRTPVVLARDPHKRKQMHLHVLRGRAFAKTAGQQWAASPRPELGTSTRFLLTTYEMSQPVYAAVPVGSGWLILKL